MSSKPFYRRNLATAISSAALLLPALSGVPAMAQDEGLYLEEIVVTARKREESLQDAPVAVSALSGQALQDAGYTNLSNLSESVPGLSLENGAGTGGAAAPYVRGIGQRDTNETLEPGVAIYIDGVYQGRPDGALMDLVDIQSIQVLRGPQGTLFGKNATGGAMVITTNKPTDGFSGNLMLRAGNYDRRDAQLTINAPLIDNKLYSRLSLSSVKRDGYTQQKIAPTEAARLGIHPDTTIEEWDDEDRLSAYGQLRWFAGDDVTVDLAAGWGKQAERGRGGHCNYALDSLEGADYFPTGGSPALPFSIYFASGFVTDFAGTCQAQEDYLELDEFYASTPGKYEVDTESLAVTVDWQIGPTGVFDDLSLKSITAWRAVDVIQNQEIDGTEMPLIDRTWDTPRESDQYSQELQLNFTALDGRLTGTSGLFLYKEATVDGEQNSFVGPFGISPVLSAQMDIACAADGNIPPPSGVGNDNSLPGCSAAPANFVSNNYNLAWFANRGQKLDTNNEMFAVFTQLSFDVNDIVSVTGGLRWNWEKKALDAAFYQANVTGTALSADEPFPETGGLYSARDLLGEFLLPAFLTGGLQLTAGDLIPPGTGWFVPVSEGDPLEYALRNQGKTWIGTRRESQIDRSWTPMLNVQFTGTDDFLDAWRMDSAMAYFTYSRGFKSGGIVPASINTLDTYDPEKVDNYEIGFKLEAWDRRVRTNIALYYMDYQDIQVTIATADPVNPVDVKILQSNAGVSAISGVEAEFTILPADGWLVQFNANYTDASYDSFEYSYVSGLGQVSRFDRADPCANPNTPFAGKISCGAEPMPFVPMWTAYLAVQYSFITDSIGIITPRVDASYKSDYSAHFDFMSYQSGDYEVAEHTIYNASVIWELPDDATRITAWVKNIEDTQVIGSHTPAVEITGGGTTAISEPRTYGVDFQYRF